MNLLLQVTDQHAATLGPNSRKFFDQHGGTVGRDTHNDWVLPDPERFISSQHFIIRCLNGMFYLEDVSTNGVFLNGSTQRVRETGDAVMLNNGDRIAVGNYDIVAAIMGAQAAIESEPAAEQNDPMPPPPAPPAVDLSESIGPVDPIAMLGNQPTPPAVEPAATFSDHSPAVSHHFEPPGVPAPASTGAIPDDWEMTGFSIAKPTPPASPGAAVFQTPNDNIAPPAQPVASAPPRLAAEPQLAPGAVHPGVPTVSARTMSIIVQGLMDILRSRSEIKSHFRVPVTTLKPVENNPLKFSATADIAMRHLFGGVEPGFMGPDAAIQEGFEDIKAHELAMMAGMRAAFEQILDRFDPRILEQQFTAKSKGSALMGIKGKGKYWDNYRQMFADLTRDSDENFNRLFGQAFATAYEQQMQKLLRDEKN